MELLLRVIVAVIVAAVIVWLLGVAGLPHLIVGLIALAGFLLVLWADPFARWGRV